MTILGQVGQCHHIYAESNIFAYETCRLLFTRFCVIVEWIKEDELILYPEFELIELIVSPLSSSIYSTQTFLGLIKVMTELP